MVPWACVQDAEQSGANEVSEVSEGYLESLGIATAIVGGIMELTVTLW